MKKLLKPLLFVFILLIVFYLVRRSQFLPSDHFGSLDVSHHQEKNQYHFIILGDTGTGDENQFAVAEAMERYCESSGGIDAIILLGDNFYMEGVSSTSDKQWQESVEAPYGTPCLKDATIYPVLGNHDYRGSTDAQIAYSRLNSQWKMPFRFYRIGFSDIMDLVVFDSTFPDFCFLPKYCAVNFLWDRLRNSKATWTLAAAHHPISSASKHGHSHAGNLFGFLMKPFVCGNADFWMSGHAHHLEHRKLPTCDTELFISGGGGGTVYEVYDEPESKFARASHGFLAMDISKDHAKFAFYDTALMKLYQYEKFPESKK